MILCYIYIYIHIYYICIYIYLFVMLYYVTLHYSILHGLRLGRGAAGRGEYTHALASIYMYFSSIPSCTRFKCTRTCWYYYLVFVVTSKHKQSLRTGGGSHLQRNPPALEAPTRGNAKMLL